MFLILRVVQAVSSGLHAKIVALENRQEEFEKFRVEVLASTDRNTKAVEALHTTLMKFLEKGSILHGENEVLTTPSTSPSQAVGLGGPSTVIEPMEDINFIDDPYEFDKHQSKELASEQPSLENNDNDGMEEQPIEGQIDGSQEPLMKRSEVQDEAEADLVVFDNLTVIGQEPKNPSKDRKFSMQLRNGKDREVRENYRIWNSYLKK